MTPPIFACMATYPPRYGMARRVIRNISPQVERMYVYVNDEGGTGPNWTVPENTVVLHGRNHWGDLGDVGKFFPLRIIDCHSFVLTVDDDLNYPSNYAEKMVEGVEKYNREAVVGLHGCDLPDEETESYYDEGQRNKINFQEKLERDRPVHLLGTGTAAFYSWVTRHLSMETFPVQNMSDIFFAIYAQEQRVGMIALRRSRAWVTPNPTPDGGIYDRYKGNDPTQTYLINQIPEWNHHVHIQRFS